MGAQISTVHRKLPRFLPVVALLAASLLFLAGCGSDDPPPNNPPSAATAASFEALDVMSSALQSAAGAPPVIGPLAIGEPVPIESQAQAVVSHTESLGAGAFKPLVVIPLTGTHACFSGTVDLTGSVDVTDTFAGGSYGTFTITTAGVTATYNLCSDGFYSVDGGPVLLSVNDSISVSNAGVGIDHYVVSIAENISGSGVTITNISSAQSFVVTFAATANLSMDFTYNTGTGQFIINVFNLFYQVTVNGQTCTISVTPQSQTAVCSA